MRRILMIMCLFVAALAVPPARAEPGNLIQGNFIGTGFVQDDGEPIFASITIDSSGLRGPGGYSANTTFSYGDTETIACSGEGTHSASDRTSATGSCSDNSHVVMRGEVIPCGNACVDAADYVVWRKNLTTTSVGGRDNAELVLLKVLDGPAESAAGHWEGQGLDERSGREVVITADFRAGAPGEVGEGTMMIGTDQFNVFYSVERPPDPGSPAGFVLVGASESGVHAYMIGEFTPPNAENPNGTQNGDLVITNSDAQLRYKLY